MVSAERWLAVSGVLSLLREIQNSVSCVFSRELLSEGPCGRRSNMHVVAAAALVCTHKLLSNAQTLAPAVALAAINYASHSLVWCTSGRIR